MFHLLPNSLRVEYAGILARNTNVEIVITTGNSIWLLNRTDSLISLQPGELFGFNTGFFAEVPSGRLGLQVYHIFFITMFHMYRERNPYKYTHNIPQQNKTNQKPLATTSSCHQTTNLAFSTMALRHRLYPLHWACLVHQ